MRRPRAIIVDHSVQDEIDAVGRLLREAADTMLERRHDLPAFRKAREGLSGPADAGNGLRWIVEGGYVELYSWAQPREFEILVRRQGVETVVRMPHARRLTVLRDRVATRRHLNHVARHLERCGRPDDPRFAPILERFDGLCEAMAAEASTMATRPDPPPAEIHAPGPFERHEPMLEWTPERRLRPSPSFAALLSARLPSLLSIRRGGENVERSWRLDAVKCFVSATPRDGVSVMRAMAQLPPGQPPTAEWTPEGQTA